MCHIVTTYVNYIKKYWATYIYRCCSAIETHVMTLSVHSFYADVYSSGGY